MLTDTKIKSLKPQIKDYIIGDIKGLLLLVKPTGKKIWEFRYTSPVNGKRRKTTFGTYPTTSLQEARKKALEATSKIQNRICPIDESRELKNNTQKILLENVINEWLETKNHLTDKTIKSINSLMFNDVLPSLKDKEMKELKHTAIW